MAEHSNVEECVQRWNNIDSQAMWETNSGGLERMGEYKSQAELCCAQHVFRASYNAVLNSHVC